MNKHEMRQMRKAWKQKQREIEELNNPRPMMYIGDVLENVALGIGTVVMMLGGGWLGCYLIYHLMVALGMY